ncbi:MAG: hypothetical protein IT372_39865 [Polyangiaceae bacterium]|nr:hypothetical protein [Polyangiaceae bacterium]
MAFDHKLPQAACRNLEAADMLYADPGRRKDVAGYLYGIAAECAIKEMTKSVSIPVEHSKDKIFYAHFPELRTLLRDALKGRNVKPLSIFVLNGAFMNHWNIKMRYADARQIDGKWVDAWRQQARDAVGAMGT